MAAGFSVELDRAMVARKVSVADLATVSGVQRQTIAAIFRRHSTPTLVVAQKLAEALDWGRLTAIVALDRTGTCPICESVFISAHERSRKFCSDACRSVDISRRHRNSRARVAVITTHRLEAFERSVADFCSSCEVEQICRDNRCPLRPVSPLPFIPLSKSSRAALA